MDKKVVVDIDGHMACILSVWSRLALPPWQPKDEINVSLQFDEPVGDVIGFAVQLPVRAYTKDEFLRFVIREGKIRVKAILVSYEASCIKQKEEEERQMKLNHRIDVIKSMIDLD